MCTVVAHAHHPRRMIMELEALDDGRRDPRAADPRASPPLALVDDLCDTPQGAYFCCGTRAAFCNRINHPHGFFRSLMRTVPNVRCW